MYLNGNESLIEKAGKKMAEKGVAKKTRKKGF